ncbi:hypothetical protein P152DRAFT_446345 [Eremomyces bilateralis CBS 781.70]|uniref:Homeobox domain-containing protein n=1 Tax=Eremomyces bilateralis CBS 781.70 TaxID=1392243 RepID=A0A6G1GFS9_9PEZI|nr:uncharacterized protein P152DRAFT_446345 [Eremomyces bilateralis CBS 781.70]KAF1816729.1 hypothetical protein P152DRAFT_446345 [Eremomyces bilateralis CBS 781.70]
MTGLEKLAKHESTASFRPCASPHPVSSGPTLPSIRSLLEPIEGHMRGQNQTESPEASQNPPSKNHSHLGSWENNVSRHRGPSSVDHLGRSYRPVGSPNGIEPSSHLERHNSRLQPPLTPPQPRNSLSSHMSSFAHGSSMAPRPHPHTHVRHDSHWSPNVIPQDSSVSHGSHVHPYVYGHSASTAVHYPRRRRGNLPKEATKVLKQWFDENRESPYPTDEQKTMLQRATGLSMNQVNNWFINARRRLPGREVRSRTTTTTDIRTPPQPL